MMSVDLFADVQLSNPSSNPQGYVFFEESVYFTTREEAHSYDEISLYRTDGTEQGTKEILQLDDRRITGEGLHVGDKLFFTTRDVDHRNDYGHELWSSDGTPEGTVAIARLGDSIEPTPTSLVTSGGTLYFSQVRNSRSELWRSDGTSGGTFKILDGVSFSSPVSVRDAVFFVGNTSVGQGLWKTDGTKPGTALVKEFTGGRRDDAVRNLIATESGDVYFIGNDGIHGRELWFSDGTAAGTRMVADYPPAHELFSPHLPSGMVTVGDRLFFLVRTRTRQVEFWTSDGTRQGTRKLTESPGQFLTRVGNSLLFERSPGGQLWITDGTIEGTHDVDRASGGFTFAAEQVYPSSPNLWTSSPLYFQDENGIGTLVRIHSDVETGTELYTDDGTDGGPMLLMDIKPGGESGTSGGIRLGNEYLFTADDGFNGAELWKTDGTTAGTHLVKNIGQQPVSFGSHPSYPTLIGDSVFFVASGRQSPGVDGDNEVWIADQANRRVRLLKDINPGRKGQPRDLDPQFISVGDTVYFIATTEQHGSELWKTNGTDEGTSLVMDIHPGGASSFFARPLTQQLFAVEDQLFFVVGETHQQLWKTKGRPEDTVQVSLPGQRVQDVIAFGERIYFVAVDGDQPSQLWRTSRDGVSVEFVPLPAARRNRFIDELTVVGDQMYFTADTKVAGGELWVTDGTTEGTRMVRDIVPGRSSSHPQELTAAGDLLYFTAVTEVGREVWVSDGTATGTRLVADVLARKEFPHRLTAVGDQVFFQGQLDDKSDHVWVTNGTHAGTRIVTSLGRNTSLLEMRAAGPKLFFRTVDHDLREKSTGQLWVSDGTPERTVRIPEIEVSSSETAILRVADNQQVFVAADDGDHGVELWRIDPLNPAGPQVVEVAQAGLGGRLDRVDSMSFRFSHDVSASLAVEDLSLTDDHGSLVPFSGTLQWDAASLTAIWAFADLRLAPGSHTARLSGANIRDTRAQSLDGNQDFIGGDDHIYRFDVRLPGDADGDGRVSIADVLVLTENFSERERHWWHGDFDGDSHISLGDFLVLAQNFGANLHTSS